MAKSSNAGGGINSNKLVRPGVRTGAPNRGVNPGYAGQLGSALGNHATEVSHALKGAAVPTETKALQTGVPYGNQLAPDSKSAPGQGRTIHATGSQGVHGKPNPGEGGHGPSRVTGKDILSGFGPERGKR
jgi:hypothetical protein